MQMRVYTASIETASISAAKTLMSIQNPADQALVILSAEVVAPDDDTNEQLHIAFQRITSGAPGTGTAVTPAKTQTGDPASGVTCTADITASEPTYTASTEHGMAGASSLGGWRYLPTLAEALTLSPSENIGLRLLTAPGTAKTLTVRVTFGEIGG